MRQKYLIQKRKFFIFKDTWGKKILFVIPPNNENLALPQFTFCCFAWETEAIVKDCNLRLQFCRAK